MEPVRTFYKNSHTINIITIIIKLISVQYTLMYNIKIGKLLLPIIFNFNYDLRFISNIF